MERKRRQEEKREMKRLEGRGNLESGGKGNPLQVVGETTQCWFRGPRAPEKQETGK